MDGTISDEEMEELEDWYDIDAGSPVYVSKSFATDESALEQRLLNRIKERIDNKTEKSMKVKRLRLKTGWAAAILCVVLTSVYFLSNKKINKGEFVDAAEHEILQPGGNRALLRLADGSTVVLDTADNGKISMEGGVSVVKVGDGQLSYKISRVSSEVLYNTIRTPAGGQYQITLSDGTKVWLNAGSSLYFPTVFNDKEREVELTGEGYFEVSHNEKWPFYVNVGDVNIKVLGTHFNVNAYNNAKNIRTTLTEGSVIVSHNELSAMLMPGQQALWDPADREIKLVKDVDINEILAWKNGYFYFTSANIQTILQEVARWYDAQIVYDGKVQETFTGSLPRSGNINKLLEVLEATGRVEFQIIGKQIIVKPK